MNSKDVTRRVAYKVRVLLKSAFLFDIEFKTILSIFDYCSSLFFHFSSQVDQLRLERSYSNAVFAYLRVNLYDNFSKSIRNFSTQNSTMMSLERQLKTLNNLDILNT